MPMLWGIVRPCLLVPAEALDWPQERRRVVLLHELAHVKRWDCLWQMLAQAACAVYWFHPLAWDSRRRMQAERERACDDLVLAGGPKASEYAHHLLEIASGLHAGRLGAAAAIAMARPNRLEGRLLAILDVKRNRRALTGGAVLAGLVLLAGLLVPVAMLRAGGEPAGQGAVPEATPPTMHPVGEPAAGGATQPADSDVPVVEVFVFSRGDPEVIAWRVQEKLRSMYGAFRAPVVTLDLRTHSLIVAGKREHMLRVGEVLGAVENEAPATQPVEERPRPVSPGTPPSGAGTESRDREREDVLGSDDAVRITIEALLAEGTESVLDRKIASSGRVSIPELGSVEIGGMTARRAEQKIGELLQAAVPRKTQVSIVVTDRRHQAAAASQEASPQVEIRIIQVRGDADQIADHAQIMLDSLYGKTAPMVEAEPETKTLYVTATKDRLDTTMQVVQMLDRASEPSAQAEKTPVRIQGPDGVEVRMIPAHHGDPEKIVDRAQRLLDNVYGKQSPLVEVYPASGSYLITGRADQVDRALEIIRNLEDVVPARKPGATQSAGASPAKRAVSRGGAPARTPQGRGPASQPAQAEAENVIKAYQLENADVRDASVVLSRALDAQYGGKAPRVIADSRTRSLIVAGRPEYMPEVEKMVQLLDRKVEKAAPEPGRREASPADRTPASLPPEDVTHVSRLFRLAHADAASTAAILAKALKAQYGDKAPSVVADTQSNTLIVSGRPEQIPAVGELDSEAGSQGCRDGPCVICGDATRVPAGLP